MAVTLGALVIAAGCSVVIAKLLDNVMGGGEDTEVDVLVLDWVVAHRTAPITTFARAVTHLGDPLVVTLLVSVVTVVLLIVRRPRLALFLVACTLGTALLTTAAKYGVDRVRPPQQLWLSAANGPAFPSGHSSQAVALYGALAVIGGSLFSRIAVRYGLVATAALVAMLVGTSRAYLGVHWLADVVAGWAVAALWMQRAAAHRLVTSPMARQAFREPPERRQPRSALRLKG